MHINLVWNSISPLLRDDWASNCAYRSVKIQSTRDIVNLAKCPLENVFDTNDTNLGNSESRKRKRRPTFFDFHVRKWETESAPELFLRARPLRYEPFSVIMAFLKVWDKSDFILYIRFGFPHWSCEVVTMIQIVTIVLKTFQLIRF